MYSVSSNAVAKAINYSETEVATGARWIDGRMIYRRVVEEATVLQVPPQTWTDTSMLASGVDVVVGVRAISSGGASWNGFSASINYPYIQIMHTRNTNEGVKYTIFDYVKTNG